MPTPEKEARVAALKEQIARASGIYLSEFTGVSVALITGLRTRIADTGAKIQVVKNRLLKLALEGTPGEGLAEFLKGPTAATFCTDDVIGPARIMKDFAKALTADNQTWQVKAALVEGRVFASAQAQALADLPSTEGIKSGVVGAIAGPTTALVQTLNAALADLVYTLQAVADKRQPAEA